MWVIHDIHYVYIHFSCVVQLQLYLYVHTVHVFIYKNMLHVVHSTCTAGFRNSQV